MAANLHWYVYKVGPQILYQKLGKEGVLLDLNSEEYFGLDEVGNRLWELLNEGNTVDACVSILLEEFDVDEARLRSDLVELVETLVAENLLIYA